MSSFWINPLSNSIQNPRNWHAAFGNGGIPDHFADFDRSLEAADREMKRMRRAMDDNLNQAQHMLANVASRPGNMLEHRTMMNPIETDPDGNRTLKCCFDMRHYKPEEVSVTLDTKEGCIKVEANHEVKDEHNRHCVKRHYLRHFYLPDDLKKEDIAALDMKSCFTQEGLLLLEAPLPKLAMVQAPPSIPAIAEPTPVAVKKI